MTKLIPIAAVLFFFLSLFALALNDSVLLLIFGFLTLLFTLLSKSDSVDEYYDREDGTHSNMKLSEASLLTDTIKNDEVNNEKSVAINREKVTSMIVCPRCESNVDENLSKCPECDFNLGDYIFYHSSKIESLFGDYDFYLTDRDFEPDDIDFIKIELLVDFSLFEFADISLDDLNKILEDDEYYDIRNNLENLYNYISEDIPESKRLSNNVYVSYMYLGDGELFGYANRIHRLKVQTVFNDEDFDLIKSNDFDIKNALNNHFDRSNIEEGKAQIIKTEYYNYVNIIGIFPLDSIIEEKINLDDIEFYQDRIILKGNTYLFEDFTLDRADVYISYEDIEFLSSEEE